MKMLYITLSIVAVLICSAQSLKHSRFNIPDYPHGYFSTYKPSKLTYYGNRIFPKHLQSEAPEIPLDEIEEFKKFIRADPTIMDSIKNGQPLSKDSLLKINNFFQTNQLFNSYFQYFENDPSFPLCYKSLEASQKKKFVMIMIEEIDFDQVQHDSDYPSQSVHGKIKSNFAKDKQLGPQVAECFDKYFQV